MRVASLFAGIGGFDLALTRLGHQIVYANEWDKYAAITYAKNFTHKLDTTDIRLVRAYDIPKHDILVGGFPCQSFSVAGKRRGFDETRGTLFFEIARILADKRPRYFLLENVKGLLSHDSGKTFQTILKVLTELGYDFEWKVLNSKNFGVPQNRERVFIAGHHRGEPRPQVFPLTRKEQEVPRTGGVVGTIQSDYFKRDRTGGYVIEAQRYPQSTQLTQGGLIVNGRIRLLTPLECERLQGFPDGWTTGVSDTQRYKQLGNAVTVNVVYGIAKQL